MKEEEEIFKGFLEKKSNFIVFVRARKGQRIWNFFRMKRAEKKNGMVHGRFWALAVEETMGKNNFFFFFLFVNFEFFDV